MIGFDPVVYSSPEGESVTFMVSLTGGSITQDIMVDFRTIAGTASNFVLSTNHTVLYYMIPYHMGTAQALNEHTWDLDFILSREASCPFLEVI